MTHDCYFNGTGVFIFDQDYRIYGITRMIDRITLLEISNPGNSLIPKIPVKNKALDEN